MRFLIPIVAIALVGACVVIFAKAIAEWVKNNRAPVETVPAEVRELFTKDDTTMMPMGSDGAMMPVSDTQYCVRFALSDGRVVEHHIPRRLYNSLAVGMRGQLTYQGTRFRDFTF